MRKSHVAISSHLDPLASRETDFGRNAKAYRRLCVIVEHLGHGRRESARLKLRELGKFQPEFSWVEIEKCILSLHGEGTVPAREPCLFPFQYLAADRARARAVLSRVRDQEARLEVRRVERELRSVANREAELALAGSRAAAAAFEFEFPTPADQEDAIRRLYQADPSKFLGVHPGTELGARIAVLVWAEMIKAGRELAPGFERDRSQRGEPQELPENAL